MPLLIGGGWAVVDFASMTGHPRESCSPERRQALADAADALSRQIGELDLQPMGCDSIDPAWIRWTTNTTPEVLIDLARRAGCIGPNEHQRLLCGHGDNQLALRIDTRDTPGASTTGSIQFVS